MKLKEVCSFAYFERKIKEEEASNGAPGSPSPSIKQVRPGGNQKVDAPIRWKQAALHSAIGKPASSASRPLSPSQAPPSSSSSSNPSKPATTETSRSFIKPLPTPPLRQVPASSETKAPSVEQLLSETRKQLQTQKELRISLEQEVQRLKNMLNEEVETRKRIEKQFEQLAATVKEVRQHLVVFKSFRFKPNKA